MANLRKSLGRATLRKTRRNDRNTRKNRRANTNFPASGAPTMPPTVRNGTPHNVAGSVQVFFKMLMNIKLYHWSTTTYSRHIASGELFDKMLELIDQYVETFMGRYKRPEFKQAEFSVHVKQLNDENVVEVLREYAQFLEHDLPKDLNETDSDLLNIRDEILGEINKTIYLFTLY
jgi:hypothetical protein